MKVTNTVNFVSFSANFTGTNAAEGLLSVYWETNLLGIIDERVVIPGFQDYTYSLSVKVTNGTYILGFRLDTFSSTTSSIAVTNVSLGFAGLRDPFLLSIGNTASNGVRLLTLTGPAGYNYSVEGSTNLIDWTPIALLVNTNGTVNFVDSETTNMSQRFYRALGP